MRKIIVSHFFALASHPPPKKIWLGEFYELNHDLSSWDSKTKLTVKNNCIIYAIFKEQINSS